MGTGASGRRWISASVGTALAVASFGVATAVGVRPAAAAVSPPAVRIADAGVVEGRSAGVAVQSAVRLSVALTTPQCIWWRTVDGTAKGATSIAVHDGTRDFQQKSGSVQIAAGGTAATITTTVNFDTAPEATETYSVVIDKTTVPVLGQCVASAAQDPTVWLARTTSRVTVIDAPAATTVNVADSSAIEGDGLKATVKVNVGLSVPLATPECVWFQTMNGPTRHWTTRTATDPEVMHSVQATGASALTTTDGTRDYQTKTGSVLIAAGKTAGAISTVVAADSVFEYNEQYTVRVTKTTVPVAGRCVATAGQDPLVAIGRSDAVVTIVNDDEFDWTTTPAPSCATVTCYVVLDGFDLAGFDFSGAPFAADAAFDASAAGWLADGFGAANANLAGARFVGSALSIVVVGSSLDGADFSGASLHLTAFGASLQRSKFVGTQLTKSLLNESDLTNATLSGAHIERTLIQGVTVTGADFGGATIGGSPSTGPCSYQGLDQDPIGFSGAPAALPTGYRMIGSHLAGPDVRFADETATSTDFSGLDLTNAWIELVDAAPNFGGTTSTRCMVFSSAAVSSAARFANAVLPGSTFRNVSGGGLDFDHANLAGSTFDNVALANANLSGTNLAGVTFTRVSSGGIVGTPSSLPAGWAVRGGYLVGPTAVLRGANLMGLNLAGVNLDGADLVAVRSGSVLGAPTLPSGWRMVNGYLVGSQADLTGANLQSQNLAAMALADTTLANANLTGANLASADLARSNMSGAILTNADLNGANLGDGGIPFSTGANFASATLLNTNLANANVSGARFAGATMQGVRSGGAVGAPASLPLLWSLRSGYFVGPGANLTSANLASVNLAGVVLTGATLTSANLSGAALTSVRSGGVIGTPASLPTNWRMASGYLVGPYADLGGATISEVNLNSAVLTGANLDGAVFISVLLRGADLTKVVARDITIDTVDLRNAFLTGGVFSRAVVNAIQWGGATCPDGFVVPRTSLTASCVGHGF